MPACAALSRVGERTLQSSAPRGTASTLLDAASHGVRRCSSPVRCPGCRGGDSGVGPPAPRPPALILGLPGGNAASGGTRKLWQLVTADHHSAPGHWQAQDEMLPTLARCQAFTKSSWLSNL